MIVDQSQKHFVSGQHRYYDPRQDEEDGFDEQYFRRRPKSFCVPPGGPGGPQGRFLPQGAPGISSMGPQVGIYNDGRPMVDQDQRSLVKNPRLTFTFFALSVFFCGPPKNYIYICKL